VLIIQRQQQLKKDRIEPILNLSYAFFHKEKGSQMDPERIIITLNRNLIKRGLLSLPMRRNLIIQE
jgi:hypothetical protein